jgi:hypothetical protein
MYIPDRVIVRKIREYDRHLFVEWNAKSQFFEVWRHMPWGRRLITPVTRSIYEPGAKRVYTPLDERILIWLFGADSYRSGGSRKHAETADQKWIELEQQKDRKRFEFYRDMAKDTYNSLTGFYTTRHASKNSGRPTFRNAKRANWSRPDIQSRTSNRVFRRSSANALKYNFQK